MEKADRNAQSSYIRERLYMHKMRQMPSGLPITTALHPRHASLRRTHYLRIRKVSYIRFRPRNPDTEAKTSVSRTRHWFTVCAFNWPAATTFASPLRFYTQGLAYGSWPFSCKVHCRNNQLMSQCFALGHATC